MKTEVKIQWLTALRSGEYAQGAMRLRRADNTFCCLGVLCDLAVKAGVIEGPTQEFAGGSYMYGAAGNSAFLPNEVGDWSGVDRFGQTSGVEEFFDVVQMNDDGATFEAIADVIEANF